MANPRINRDLLKKLLPNDRAVREFEKTLDQIQYIEENIDNITTNTENIALNAAGIAANATSISTNAANILLRALLNGDATKLFSVADATSSKHAVNYSQVIGLGQTWQNVVASRAVSTSYQNTTGKPIYVSIGGSSGSHPVEVSSNGSTWVQVGLTGSGASNSFVVPNNYYYRVNGAATISYWAELR